MARSSFFDSTSGIVTSSAPHPERGNCSDCWKQSDMRCRERVSRLSPLPQDLCRLQRNDRVRMVRNDPHRVITRWACGGHVCAVDVATEGTDQGLVAAHFLAHVVVVVYGIGIEFYLHRLWINFTKIHRQMKSMVTILSGHVEIAKVDL